MLVNRVPPDYKLPPLPERSQTDKFFGDEIHWMVEAMLDLPKCLDGTPAEFRLYVLGDSLKLFERAADEGTPFMLSEDETYESAVKVYEAVQRYENFIRLRKQLFRLIGTVKSLETNSKRRAYPVGLPVLGSTKLLLNEDGSVTVEKDLLSAALDEDGVDLTRVRLCEGCGVTFWKGRSDQKCCTTRCAHAWRNRRLRENYAADPVGHVLRRNGVSEIQKRRKATTKL